MTLPEAARALLSRLEFIERSGHAFATGKIRHENGTREGYKVAMWLDQADELRKALGEK